MTKNIAIILYSKVPYEEANYLELYYEQANFEKSLL